MKYHLFENLMQESDFPSFSDHSPSTMLKKAQPTKNYKNKKLGFYLKILERGYLP